MSSVTIDLDAARALLEKAWAAIGSTPKPMARTQQLIDTILSSTDVTFKYILVTGFLAKCVNSRAHARAIQASSALPGAYDARSLAHKVVVGFEKSKGNLFGLSNEPFVNKPARHPEHRGDNPQLRNKILSQHLHDALEMAQQADGPEVFRGLVHILRLGAERAANTKQIDPTIVVNLNSTVKFIQKFLESTDGGARLVGVWAAIEQLLSPEGEVKVYSPNASDFFGKTAGDVELYYDDILVCASECKQRPISLDDVNHGISKAIANGVPEYRFVISAGVVPSQERQIFEALHEHSGKIDLPLIDISKDIRLLAAMLNPAGRAKLGPLVVEFLRKMRKFESANSAADLWNTVTD